VVEYNTSTNPTFEGAVRDTSGRGLDGVFYGTAAYNSTSKDLYFDGNSDFIETDLGKEVFKNSSIHTTSLWVKMNHHDTDFQILFSLGNGEGNPTGNLKHINLYHSSNHGLRLSFTQHDYRLGDVAPVGNWVHVVYTYDGTTWQNSTTPTNVNIYINGVKVVVTTVYQIGGGGGSALDLTTAQLALGAGSTNITDISRNYTDAAISQFKLYDTALTAEEVKTLYDMGRCDEGHHTTYVSRSQLRMGGENLVIEPCIKGFYEEGTWSPIMGGQSGGVKTASSNNTGWFIRVGNLVSIGGTLAWSGGDATIVGNPVIGGFPYRSTTVANARTALSWGVVSTGFTTPSGYTTIRCIIDPNQNFAYIIAADEQNAVVYTHSVTVADTGLVYGLGGTYKI
jgi:hypothetical protein